jgi:hypothetical protein
LRIEETVVDQLFTTRVEKHGLRQCGSTEDINTKHLKMRYYIRVSKQAAQEILAHLENKAAIIPRSNEDSSHDFLHVDIDNGEDLLKIFHAGIALSDNLKNQNQWYYSENHL